MIFRTFAGHKQPISKASVRQGLQTGLVLVSMRKVRQVLVVAVVLAAAWAIGATAKKAAPVNAAHYETATLAGGCFWSLQETLRQIPGVIKTTVGYTGGTMANPTYEQVAGGKTGHMEAVEVVFDPGELRYEDFLADFLAARNPASQSTNMSAGHRSTIFYHNEAQRLLAERAKDKISRSRKWKFPVVAEINPAAKFYPAEEYHQDYYRKTAVEHRCELEKD
jgi:methionine-S-sulfoxide reductase